MHQGVEDHILHVVLRTASKSQSWNDSESGVVDSSNNICTEFGMKLYSIIHDLLPNEVQQSKA